MLVNPARNHPSLFECLREIHRLAGMVYFGVAASYHFSRCLEYDISASDSIYFYPLWGCISQVVYFGLGVAIDFSEQRLKREVKHCWKTFRDYLGACVAFPSALFAFIAFIKTDYALDTHWFLLEDPPDNPTLYQMLCFHPIIFHVGDAVLARKRYPSWLSSFYYVNAFCTGYTACLWSFYLYNDHWPYWFLDDPDSNLFFTAGVFFGIHYIGFIIGKLLNMLLWNRRVKWQSFYKDPSPDVVGPSQSDI